MPEEKDKVASGPKRKVKPRSVQPTVVTPPRRNDPHLRAAGANAPPVRTPTTIPGVERTRIRAATSDLRTLSPGAAPQIYERASALIGTFVPDRATERKAVLWGHELQKSYSDLVTETLRLSQAPLLRKVEGYLARMLDILGAIDLMAVCGQEATVIARYFKGINKTIDTPDELNAAQAELERLLAHMSAALGELLTLKERLEQHARTVHEISVGIEASALAALFLSRHLQATNSVLAARFMERSMRLTQTLAQIRSGDATREIQVEHPIRMVSAIQHVALVMMPGWLGSITSALTLLRRSGLSKTDVGELTYQLRDIITQLKTEGDTS